jgi:ABC-2 type transport system permease protein
MAELSFELGVLRSQLRYQLTLLARNPRALITALVLPALVLALELGKVQRLGGTTAGMTTLAPRVAGLFVFGAAAIAMMTHALTLVVAREDGVLRRWRASPLPAGTYFTAKIVASVLAADLAGAVLVLISVEMAKMHLTGHAIVAMLAGATLGALALAAIGTAITALIPTAQGAQPVLMIIYLPLVFLSGSLGPTSTLPHWLTTVVTYLPVQPMIDALSHAMTSGGGSLMPVHDLLVLVGWLAIGLVASLLFFRWDPSRPRHAR